MNEEIKKIIKFTVHLAIVSTSAYGFAKNTKTTASRLDFDSSDTIKDVIMLSGSMISFAVIFSNIGSYYTKNQSKNSKQHQEHLQDLRELDDQLNELDEFYQELEIREETRRLTRRSSFRGNQ